MSILSDLWGDLRALFFPLQCPVCGRPLGDGMRTVCTRCRIEAPLTEYWRQFDNPLVRSFWGLLPVMHASALLFFSGGGGWRRLIHDFKYRGNWRLAREMGIWYGAELAECDWYRAVGVQSVGVSGRGNRRGAGLRGGPAEREPSAQQLQSDPAFARGALGERRGSLPGASARAAAGTSYPAGRRRADYPCHDGLVRRSHSARRARLPDQRSRPGRLEAPSRPSVGHRDAPWMRAAHRSEAARPFSPGQNAGAVRTEIRYFVFFRRGLLKSRSVCLILKRKPNIHGKRIR